MARPTGRQLTLRAWRKEADAVVTACIDADAPLIVARGIILRKFKACRVAPPADVLSWATRDMLRDKDDETKGQASHSEILAMMDAALKTAMTRPFIG